MVGWHVTIRKNGEVYDHVDITDRSLRSMGLGITAACEEILNRYLTKPDSLGVYAEGS
jgi:hypothetical protein